MLNEGFLENIYYRYWEIEKPETAIANVFAIHGLGGHSIWFDNAAGFFNKRKINFFSFDLPGFGQSKYPKGQIDSYNSWIEITKSTLEKFLHDFNIKAPVFILGHSLGALLSILLSEKVKANGWILSVPGFEGHKETWPLFSFIFPVLAKAVLKPEENIIFPFGPELLTKNEEVRQKVKRDPLRVVNVSARLFMQVYLLSLKAKEAKTFPKDPVIVLKANQDKICSNVAIERYFNELLNNDKCMKSYTNSFHDLFIEDELGQIVNDISVWIIQHLS